jgi:hypothetical protein
VAAGLTVSQRLFLTLPHADPPGLRAGHASEPRERSAPARPSENMRRSYVRVLLVWAITLIALYAFQEYFS